MEKSNPRDSSAKFLLFSAVGDSIDNFTSWNDASSEADKEARKLFDIAVVYYGSDDERREEIKNGCNADVFADMKGSKFQIFSHFFKKQPDMFQQYDFVWITDDDIALPPSRIYELFSTCQEHNFPVAQPAFGEGGKHTPYALTKFNPRYKFSFVSFVEMTCPVFRMDKLLTFNEFYYLIKHELCGWGVDFVMTNVLHPEKEPFAIVHDVQVVNPAPSARKSKIREITTLMSNIDRRKQWLKIRSRFKFRETLRVYKHVLN